jgi:hypothetical protein
MIQGSIGDSTGSIWRKSLLAGLLLLIFSTIPSFPNVFSSPNEWGDYFPIFGKCEEDNLAQNLSEFHELMHQWEIHHEDVLLKMFMFSLAGDAHRWYHSLPPTSISSLSEFHVGFTSYRQKLYPS